MSATTHGAPSWVDLSTPDVDASIDFYRELLGWEFETQTTEMGEYHVASVGGRQVCGLMAQSAEMGDVPSSWTVFIDVADIDEAVRAFVDAGGRILQPPFPIPGGAKVSVATDPVGAMFALISGGPAPERSWLSRRPGAACWVETLSRDVAASRRFYESVFGWVASTDEVDHPYTTFMLDGMPIAGLLEMPAQVPDEAPSHWAVYFAVADCERTERLAEDLGGSVLVPATPVEVGRFAVLADPLGAAFDVMDFAAASTMQPIGV